MGAAVGAVGELGRDLREEVDDLRRGLLPVFLLPILAASWLWFLYITVRTWEPGLNDIAAFALGLGACLALMLRERHHPAACWVLLASMVGAEGLIVKAQPASLAVAFGSLVVIVTNALLGSREAFIIAAVAAGTVIIAARAGAKGVELPYGAAEVTVLYFLTWGAATLSARPLKTSVERALTGWTRARDALAESRQRRGELNRVIRALDEATYRLERMNQELIVARREAELARILKARFAATVSHELRGPLDLVLGFSRMIALSPERYGVPLPSAYRADVDAIYRNTQHLASLVDDILDLSQIEAERLPLIKDRVDLEEDVVRKAANTVRPLAERKDLFLHVELAGGLPWVLADHVRLRQVLLNLLMNAIRLTEFGGVTVRTKRMESELVVSVQDTGPGIAPEDLPRLFEEFQQVTRANERGKAGTGLGLSISKRLVELHGGRIWVESRKGAGAAFSFSVPLPGAESLAADTVITEESPHRMPISETCLIIHDDPSVVRLLGRYIEEYRVVGLTDQREVVSLMEELHPRAIVTSPELTAAVQKELARTPYDVPVITCAMPRLGEQTELEGVLSYIIKPIKPEILNAVMRQIERDEETTLLLVDDEPDAVRLLESMLTAIPRPYRILKAYDGEQALETMKTTIPDVVFIDLLMPGLSGEETIARIRADERLCHVPIVIVSAKDWTEGQAAMKMPISVQTGRPISVARWAKCLQSLLDALNPRYLPEPALS
jgi:signal transduction histidine kinase/CheY-like chemotaxis protein